MLVHFPENGNAAAITVTGGGPADVADLFSTLASGYLNVRDDVAISFVSSSVEKALLDYHAGNLDFVYMPTALTPELVAPYKQSVADYVQLPISGKPHF